MEWSQHTIELARGNKVSVECLFKEIDRNCRPRGNNIPTFEQVSNLGTFVSWPWSIVPLPGEWRCIREDFALWLCCKELESLKGASFSGKALKGVILGFFQAYAGSAVLQRIRNSFSKEVASLAVRPGVAAHRWENLAITVQSPHTPWEDPSTSTCAPIFIACSSTLNGVYIA